MNRFSLFVGLMLSLHSSLRSADVREEWVARYRGQGNGDNVAVAIAVDQSGNSYVTGSSTEVGFTRFITTIKYDPSGGQVWIARHGNGSVHDQAAAITVDQKGNVYVIGSRWFVETDVDYVTIKYDANGNELWSGRYNGPGNRQDVATALAVDADGGVYVTGGSWGGFRTSVDYATIKYDADGTQVWVARYNAPDNGNDFPTAMALNKRAEVYVTGTSGMIGALAYATVKYDSSGQQIWVSQYRGPGERHDDRANAMAVDLNGDVYVTGESDGLGTGPDYATLKYSSSGKLEWVSRYNGPGNGPDRANGIALDDYGNVYVTGGSLDAIGRYEYATIKYDPDGEEIWVARYGGVGLAYNIARSITVDADQRVYVAGDSLWFNGLLNYATIVYDPDGAPIWDARYTGPANGNDTPHALMLDAEANVFVTGASEGGDGRYDYATIKYPPRVSRQKSWP
jgi:hypothetical protein